MLRMGRKGRKGPILSTQRPNGLVDIFERAHMLAAERNTNVRVLYLFQVVCEISKDVQQPRHPKGLIYQAYLRERYLNEVGLDHFLPDDVAMLRWKCAQATYYQGTAHWRRA